LEGKTRNKQKYTTFLTNDQRVEDRKCYLGANIAKTKHEHVASSEKI
jgi:hypothetical protein